MSLARDEARTLPPSVDAFINMRDLVVGDKANVGELNVAAEEAVHAAVQKIQTSFRRSFARRDRREQREARRRVDGSVVPVAWGGGG